MREKDLFSQMERLKELLRQGQIDKKEFELLKLRLIQERVSDPSHRLTRAEFLASEKTITDVDFDSDRDAVTRIGVRKIEMPEKSDQAPSLPPPLPKGSAPRHWWLTAACLGLGALCAMALSFLTLTSERPVVRRIAAICASLSPFNYLSTTVDPAPAKKNETAPLANQLVTEAPRQSKAPPNSPPGMH